MKSSHSMLPRNRTMGPPSSPLVFLVTHQLQALSVLIFKRKHSLPEALPSSFLRNTVRFQTILPIRYRFSWNGEGSVCGLPGALATSRLTSPWEESQNSSGAPYLIPEVDMVSAGVIIVDRELDETQAQNFAVEVKRLL